jgi:hypothetical protein
MHVEIFLVTQVSSILPRTVTIEGPRLSYLRSRLWHACKENNDGTSDMLNSIGCLHPIVLLTCSSLTAQIKHEIIIFLHCLNKYGEKYL